MMSSLTFPLREITSKSVKFNETVAVYRIT